MLIHASANKIKSTSHLAAGLALLLLSTSGSAETTVTSTASSYAIPLDRELTFEYVNYGMDNIKCVFDSDPHIALFVSFDSWTAKCLRDQKIREDRMIIGRVHFAERDTSKPERKDITWISTDGWRVYRNPFHDLAQNHDLKVFKTEESSELHYEFQSIKRMRALGKRHIYIPIGGFEGRADLLDTDGEVIDSRKLNCETKFWVTMNGSEVEGYRDDTFFWGKDSLVGCGRRN